MQACLCFFREIEALRYRSIVSVSDTTHVIQAFPEIRGSGTQLILCENGKAHSSNFRRDNCGFTPFGIPDPVIEIASQRSVGHFLRTKQSIYILQETGLCTLTSIPKPDKIVKMIAVRSLLAFRYSDGTVKIFNKNYLELPVFLEAEQVTLQSVEIFHTGGYVFISMNSRFFKIELIRERAQLTDFTALAGKKVMKVAANGRFVFTEKEGVWATGGNQSGCLGIGNTIFQENYVQVLTLDHISEIFDISNIFESATLFLAGGKLYFAGAGGWRYLVSNNPQEEYTVPTPISNTQHLTIKSVWSSGKNIWVLAETGIYQLNTVDNPLAGSLRYDAPPTHYFRDLESIPFNIAMLTVWNKMYAEWVFKSADVLDANAVIREAISSSSNLDELYAKVEKLRDDMPTCTELNKFFQYLRNEKKIADEPQA